MSRIVLNHCEICGKKLTDEEKSRYGVECKECRDDLANTIQRALKDVKFDPETLSHLTPLPNVEDVETFLGRRMIKPPHEGTTQGRMYAQYAHLDGPLSLKKHAINHFIQSDFIDIPPDMSREMDLKMEQILSKRMIRKMTENENVEEEQYRYVGGHHFRRISEVSSIGGKLLYYQVKCVNCGITGKRKDLQSPVERDERYADEKYATCEKGE